MQIYFKSVKPVCRQTTLITFHATTRDPKHNILRRPRQFGVEEPENIVSVPLLEYYYHSTCALRAENELLKSQKSAADQIMMSQYQKLIQERAQAFQLREKLKLLCDEVANLYDLCLQILLTTRLEETWLVNFVEGTLHNYACADVLGLTVVTMMMENH